MRGYKASWKLYFIIGPRCDRNLSSEFLTNTQASLLSPKKTRLLKMFSVVLRFLSSRAIKPGVPVPIIMHVLSGHSKKDQKLFFKTEYRLRRSNAILSTFIKLPSAIKILFC